jgi:hypothetical protein
MQLTVKAPAGTPMTPGSLLTEKAEGDLPLPPGVKMA